MKISHLLRKLGSTDLLAGLVVGVIVGLMLGWQLWHHAPVVEGEAIERKLSKGAIVAERVPDAPIAQPLVKAAQEAKRGKVVRAVHVTVRAAESHDLSGSSGPASLSSQPLTDVTIPAPPVCPPIDVDLALVEARDGSMRAVITSSGTILEATDIPVRGATVRKQTRWAAGASYSTRKEPGAWVDRAIGPFVVGAAVEKRSDGLTGIARVGIRW